MFRLKLNSPSLQNGSSAVILEKQNRLASSVQDALWKALNAARISDSVLEAASNASKPNGSALKLPPGLSISYDWMRLPNGKPPHLSTLKARLFCVKVDVSRTGQELSLHYPGETRPLSYSVQQADDLVRDVLARLSSPPGGGPAPKQAI